MCLTMGHTKQLGVLGWYYTTVYLDKEDVVFRKLATAIFIWVFHMLRLNFLKI